MHPDILIPSTTQLNNFLKYIREQQSSTKGAALCLQDFDDFFAAHRNVPEDPDGMFVADCKTDTVKEKVNNVEKIILLFRIFFTTTRLLSFTQHVCIN